VIEGRRSAKTGRGRDAEGSSSESEDAPASEAFSERAQTLARAFRAGRIEAFGELVDLFKERFYRVAYRVLGNPDDALDVTQDAFVRIHRGISSWDERAAFFSWSSRIVTNLAIDTLRKKGRDRKARTQAALERPEAHDDPEPQEVSQEDVARLVARAREAIESLPPGQKAIVALRHYENLSLKEIAEIRGCAVGTVKSTLHQAFTSLRRALGGDAGSLALAAKRQEPRDPSAGTRETQ
jgi:RNA polymerase sigma-70 factor (ECF subfamily)